MDLNVFNKFYREYKDSHQATGRDASTLKGKALEDLVYFLLSSVLAFGVKRNVQTQTNQLENPVKVQPCTIQHPFIHAACNSGGIIIIECKNEDGKIDINYIQKMGRILSHTGAKIGIFFSREGFTGRNPYEAAQGERRILWYSQQMVIFAITEKDLIKIAQGEINFLQLLWDKYCDFTLGLRRPWEEYQ